MRQNKKALTSFLESETVELKLDYTESIRKDIIASSKSTLSRNAVMAAWNYAAILHVFCFQSNYFGLFRLYY